MFQSSTVIMNNMVSLLLGKLIIILKKRVFRTQKGLMSITKMSNSPIPKGTEQKHWFYPLVS